jgi:hypothetical protein
MASQLCFCSITLLCPVCISVLCLLYTLHHIHLMQPSSTMHLSSCTLPPCSHLNPPHDNNNHLFFVHHSYSTCAPYACNIHNASTCTLRAKFLCNLSALSNHHHGSSTSLVIFHHVSSITGCSAEISQPLWQLRLLILFGAVELMPYVSVIVFNAHPYINPPNNHLTSLDED